METSSETAHLWRKR